MIIPTSVEFVALCQSQVLVLTQALGITSTVVYLAERTGAQADLTLVPVFVYPEMAKPWGSRPQTPLIAPETPALDTARIEGESAVEPVLGGALLSSASWNLEAADQLVRPMVHEGVVLGVLVCTKPTPWQAQDRQQAEQVARSLALACVLDQRGQWLQRRLQQKQLHRGQLSEQFHDLLHQFRNPLTAMRTFGKLLMKRLGAEDINHPIAEGIVRESDRLQVLLLQFDAAVALEDAELQQPETPPSTATLALPPASPAHEGGSSTGEEALQEGILHQLSMSPSSLDAVINPLLISAQAVAQERRLRLGQVLVPDLPPVLTDESAIREVISNLLDNALKYAPAGAWVWIVTGLMREQNGLSYQGVAIGDTGPGIPSEDQPHIFDRSFRGVQAEGEIPGTGLGLAIAQELLKAMGGFIELYSPAALSGLVPDDDIGLGQGPGSVFILWLQQSEG